MKIVVAVDGSANADRALQWAANEARLRSATLTALHAIHVARLSRTFSRDRDHGVEHVAGMDLVHDAFARVGVDPDDVRVEVPLITGRGAAAAVLHNTQDADLVVLGSRGLGGFPGLLLGSVSQQVAAHARVPVAIIPAARDEDHDRGHLDSTSVVVGVDGSSASRRALRWGVEEAQLRAVPIVAIAAHPPADPVVADATSATMSELDDYARRQARRALDDVVEHELGEQHHAVERRVIAGRPAAVLIDEAATPSSLLVIGSRGRGGFAGLLLGSVSQQCMTHTRGPLVVVHAH